MRISRVLMTATLAGVLVFQAAVFFVFGFETKGRALEDVGNVDPTPGGAQGETRPAARLS